MKNTPTKTNLPMRQVYRTWWPLAASWLLIGAELPLISAFIARLAHPEINLAAYGSVVFPLATIISGPIVMILAASTALSRDWPSYLKLRRFTMISAAFLTALHVLVAFTPLYYVIVRNIMGMPEEIVAPARIGLMIMTPWTWSLAYRRFNQGVLIRFGYTRLVGACTLFGFSMGVIVLAIGYLLGNLPGVVVGSLAVAVVVMSEAIYVWVVIRPVRKLKLMSAPVIDSPLTLKAFLKFYTPLALTSLLLLAHMPMGSAALARMPLPLESLAAWPVVSGLVFMLRGLGMAYNEVVVALLDESKSSKALYQFTVWLAGITTVGLLIISATPLSQIWFERVSGLNPELVTFSRQALWLGLLLPGLNVYQSWYQGALVHGRRTQGVIEAVVIFMVASGFLLYSGVVWGKITGLYIGMAVFTISMALQTAWLWLRSRQIMKAIEIRDTSKDVISGYRAAAD
jgi:hypothetical protein